MLGLFCEINANIIFRLGYFERNYSFLTQKQLTSEATQHYVGQAVKQLYVLVLGLDVLGNPYGLVLGITKGVEDLFYEPIQVLLFLLNIRYLYVFFIYIFFVKGRYTRPWGICGRFSVRSQKSLWAHCWRNCWSCI